MSAQLIAKTFLSVRSVNPEDGFDFDFPLESFLSLWPMGLPRVHRLQNAESAVSITDSGYSSDLPLSALGKGIARALPRLDIADLHVCGFCHKGIVASATAAIVVELTTSLNLGE